MMASVQEMWEAAKIRLDDESRADALPTFVAGAKAMFEAMGGLDAASDDANYRQLRAWQDEFEILTDGRGRRMSRGKK